eukprot:scaffold6241_cov64-Phaeocystis_antarctica.AAC.8
MLPGSEHASTLPSPLSTTDADAVSAHTADDGERASETPSWSMLREILTGLKTLSPIRPTRRDAESRPESAQAHAALTRAASVSGANWKPAPRSHSASLHTLKSLLRSATFSGIPIDVPVMNSCQSNFVTAPLALVAAVTAVTAVTAMTAMAAVTAVTAPGVSCSDPGQTADLPKL